MGLLPGVNHSHSPAIRVQMVDMGRKGWCSRMQRSRWPAGFNNAHAKGGRAVLNGVINDCRLEIQLQRVLQLGTLAFVA